jgi:hypothetical protein
VVRTEIARGEPERRHAQQDEQRSHLRRRLALAWEVQMPSLAVVLVAVGKQLDEGGGDAVRGSVHV